MNSQLKEEELETILYTADSLIMRGCRSFLALVLKGSKSKKIMKHKLDKNKNYGIFSNYTLKEIKSKIKFMIEDDWLRTEYDGKLPLLVHSPKGWDVVKKIWVDELLKDFDERLENNQTTNIYEFIKNINRQIKFMLLDKINNEKLTKYKSILKNWQPYEVRKIRNKIGNVIRDLEENETSIRV